MNLNVQGHKHVKLQEKQLQSVGGYDEWTMNRDEGVWKLSQSLLTRRARVDVWITRLMISFFFFLAIWLPLDWQSLVSLFWKRYQYNWKYWYVNIWCRNGDRTHDTTQVTKKNSRPFSAARPERRDTAGKITGDWSETDGTSLWFSVLSETIREGCQRL